MREGLDGLEGLGRLEGRGGLEGPGSRDGLPFRTGAVAKAALGPDPGRHPARTILPRRPRPPGQPRRARCAPVETLRDALLHRADRAPDATAFYLCDLEDGLATLTCGELLTLATRVAGGLRDRDVGPGDRVLLCFDTAVELLAAFFGCVAAGAVPALVEPPRLPGRTAGWSATLEERRQLLGARALLLDDRLKPQVPEDGECRGLIVLGPADFPPRADPLPAIAVPSQRSPAFLQFTSGTTNQARAVMVHHRPLFSNARSIAEASAWNDDDLVVSWLPLHHDMGLAGLTLAPFLHGLPVALLPPLAFILRPSRWLWALHYFRGTVSGGPNFAYHLLATRTTPAELAGLDLRSWRLAYNGAEMIQPATLRKFQERFGPHGFGTACMVPVYGMSEMVVAATFPIHGVRPRLDTIDREILAAAGRAVPVAATSPRALTLVGVGPPLPGHQIEIVDPAGSALPERRQGQVRLRGPSVTAGYFAAPETTARVFGGGWLATGDLGYLADGELFVCGREKDLIIKAGCNYHPHSFEAAAASVPGVRAGAVAAFGTADGATGSEEVVIVFETDRTDGEGRRQLCRQVEAAVFDQVAIRPARIIPVPPRSLPKTSSGKLARAAVRQRYQGGAFAASAGEP
jgi:fatty-acyl-CoA synthase